jgi:hypothetical protein
MEVQSMSTTPVNSGLSNLLDLLSSAGSPIASMPQVSSALQNAPAGDIVQLTQAATELQNVDAIFGDASSSTPASIFDPELAFPTTDTASSTGTTGTQAADSASTGASPADQVAAYQASLQSAEVSALFGMPGQTTTGSVNLFG